ncbi:MAG: hypothetical protein CMG55_06955 [Candidatus Marinimicrobia bacterium]|nr:hypothetical protein [Candidatus Neomarinimicrobiota bacterium]|tara:strand:- start:677 stop:1486 length:810 start_codon:yes stop_codon:yes gene_type:complete
MIIARLFPKKSNYFNRLNSLFVDLGKKMDSMGLLRLFSLWTLVVAGTVVGIDINERFVYWSWQGWAIGLMKIIIISILYLFILKPNNLWEVGSKILSNREILIHTIVSYLLLIFGNIGVSGLLPNFIGLIPYSLAFLSGLLVFQFPLILDENKGEWNHFDWNNKIEYFSFSLLLMLFSVVLGIYLDDPIISTAGSVSVPFPLITLVWPNHVRHLQRARFFPLFSFAMFLCVRVPWFLIPLCSLFFIIRTINYFRYGIVFPSFGVDFLEE